MLIRGLT